uniref:Melanin-concentrating hormone n=1 Tax=Plectus sambesii TaxID=2011161 RepID=A0A914VM76_9BILA
MRFMLACLLFIVSTTALPLGDQDESDDLSDQLRDKRRIGLRIPNIVYLKNSMPINDMMKRRIGLRIPNIIYLQNQAKKDEVSSEKRKRRIGLRIPNIVYLRNAKMYDDEGAGDS